MSPSTPHPAEERPAVPGRRVSRALLIVNPASRRGSYDQASAIAAFERAGVRCDSFLTSAPGHGGAIAAEAGLRYDAIFALGGDGTAMEVISAVGPSGPPVGVLPGGTGNILARAFGIPLRISAAVTALLNGGDALIDLGRLDTGHRFAIGAGVGADAAMISETPSHLKRHLGILAYLLFGARAVLRFDRFIVRANVDGRAIEAEASSALVANLGSLLNDFITLGDGIRHDDGLLNLCIFCPRNTRDALRITSKLLRRDFTPDPCLVYAEGKRIRLETEPQRPVQADGELIGTTPFAVTVEPLAGRLLLPRQSSPRSAQGAARNG